MRRNRSEYRTQYIIGLVFIIITVFAFLNVLLGLSRTDKADFYLRDVSYQRFGWEYEILSDGNVTAETPEFGEYDAISFPEESIQAVSISRVMTEDIPRSPEIEMLYYSHQLIEVFLDDLLLFSELPNGERNEEGFLLLDETDPKVQRESALKHEYYPYGNTVRISLPDDYQGKTLKIITYFFGDSPKHEPVYPTLGSYESRYAPYLADLVMPIAALILYAVCFVILLLVFVLDIPNDRKDSRIFLLALYFLLLFIYTLKGPTVSVIAETDDHALIQILGEFYVLPLCLYLALLFGGWKRWLLLGGTAIWSVYIAVQLWMTAGSGYFMADAVGRGSFLLALLFLTVFLLDFIVRKRKQVDRKRALMYTALTVTVFALCVFSEARRAYDGDILECLEVVFSLTFFDGYFVTLMALIQNTCAAMAIIVLVVEFLRRSTETQTMVTVLEERSRATREEYYRMLDAESATHSLRHEISHHMTALMGFLREGENERAEEYIASVVKELNNLPVFRYSENTIVNVIAGSYLDRAAKEGIRIRHKLSVSEKLEILDEDLSVFLSNMLQNALEACERMNPESERYIYINMNVHGNYLAIGCTNSMSPEAEEASDAEQQRRRPGKHRHGYGLKAMSNIAEKYGSLLNIEKTSAEFSVKTLLNMKCTPPRQG